MFRFLTSPRFYFPVVIILAVTILSLSIDDFWSSITSGRLFAPPAQAETTQNKNPNQTADNTAAAGKTDTAPAPASAPNPPTVSDTTASDSPIGAPPTGDEEKSAAEIEVLKQLSQRREKLEQRAKELDQREDVIKVAELRVDKKIHEMEVLRQQLYTMVNQVSEAQAAQLDNTVKIYETMKPEEAAKIFENMGMPDLLNVVKRMKPKSTAPIMAKMAPEKAREITVALTHQDQLPEVK